MIINDSLEFNKGNNYCQFKMMASDKINNDYLEGLRSQKSYLIDNPDDITFQYQKEYIDSIIESEDDSIFGLWVNNMLIGTSGAQNITIGGTVSIGIFIFNKKFRSRGFGKTMVWASCMLIKSSINIESFSASMFKKNLPSLNSFLSIGFIEDKVTDRKVRLKLAKNKIQKPNDINFI